MSIALRVQGWISRGAVIPVSVESFAEVVGECRRLSDENDALAARSTALRALVHGIGQGVESDAFLDAYRRALQVLKTND